jgi:CRP-like cAMP-binding protein
VRRTASVVATKYSEVLSLSKASLEETVAQYPVYAGSIIGEVAAYNELVQEVIGKKAAPHVRQPGNTPASAPSIVHFASAADARTSADAPLPTRIASLQSPSAGRIEAMLNEDSSLVQPPSAIPRRKFVRQRTELESFLQSAASNAVQLTSQPYAK